MSSVGSSWTAGLESAAQSCSPFSSRSGAIDVWPLPVRYDMIGKLSCKRRLCRLATRFGLMENTPPDPSWVNKSKAPEKNLICSENQRAQALAPGWLDLVSMHFIIGDDCWYGRPLSMTSHQHCMKLESLSAQCCWRESVCQASTLPGQYSGK